MTGPSVQLQALIVKGHHNFMRYARMMKRRYPRWRCGSCMPYVPGVPRGK